MRAALIAMGGDGTNFHVLNGVLKFHGDGPLPPLGIIPDGELFGTTPTTVTLLPRRVRYFAGM